MNSHSFDREEAVIFSCLAVPVSQRSRRQLSAADAVAGGGQLQPAVAPLVTINTGDNAWLLASSALVLMMTAPGLILFYGGLVRTKNVLSTMMHSLILMALISALWMVFGYSMAFARGQRLLRQSAHAFVSERRRRRAGRGLRADDSGADVHAVSDDVRHHHAGAHQRRGGRTHEVQGVCRCSCCCG